MFLLVIPVFENAASSSINNINNKTLSLYILLRELWVKTHLRSHLEADFIHIDPHCSLD